MTFENYSESVKRYSLEELREIAITIDKDKFPDRYKLVLEEKERKFVPTLLPIETPNKLKKSIKDHISEKNLSKFGLLKIVTMLIAAGILLQLPVNALGNRLTPFFYYLLSYPFLLAFLFWFSIKILGLKMVRAPV